MITFISSFLLTQSSQQQYSTYSYCLNPKQHPFWDSLFCIDSNKYGLDKYWIPSAPINIIQVGKIPRYFHENTYNYMATGKSQSICDEVVDKLHKMSNIQWKFCQGYECMNILVGSLNSPRCCSSRGLICSLPYLSGTLCGSGIMQRWYYNRITGQCQTFNFNG